MRTLVPLSPAAPIPREEATAVFEIEGDRVRPSWYAQGPWDPRHQHGGAACALLARTLEGVPCAPTLRFKRIHFDLMRGIPMTPLRTTTRVVRDGRRIQLVDASVWDGDVEVARASGLRMRQEPGLQPENNRVVREPLPYAPGEGDLLSVRGRIGHDIPGFIGAIDFVRADGEPTGSGTNTVWIRSHLPIVAGEEPTPLVRLAAACDFTSGISNALDFERFTSINPDVTLQVHREPKGEWIAVQGSTELEDDGTGQSRAGLYDATGRIADCLTSLLVSRRG